MGVCSQPLAGAVRSLIDRNSTGANLRQLHRRDQGRCQAGSAEPWEVTAAVDAAAGRRVAWDQEPTQPLPVSRRGGLRSPRSPGGHTCRHAVTSLRG